ncbi:DUF5709 domain-containing protein [Nocardioides marinus]|uniref:DUF5709 domain-containing protein n=1 Tax=Nocardioides marinus TaxID=374514 RepID=A0A7Z0C3I6_9ACTN|nr:DUF5709 domain-containing protein [Nocardioides marinus]NYI09129.1 hypothetical protein [Nocardioides marinus]
MSQSEPTETDLDATTAAETYGDYSVDDEDQPVGLDNLTDVEGDVEDELDRGYSPPEKYSPGQGYGNTPYEEATGESLDQRIAQEVPEPDPYTDVPTEDLDDGEVGDQRAGRLVDPDQGLGEDTEKDLVGDDVGIDGAAASPEEAAVHVVPED